MSIREQDSVAKFHLKKLVEAISSKKGRGTELITLYIPHGRSISDVTNYLRQEYATASNIKSSVTRKHVLDALTKVIQYLKLFKEVPKNGLAIFCGAIPRGSPGSERMEMYSLIPPEPVNIFLYRCDDSFFLDPLKEMLVEKETYGIMIIDGNEATYATLSGKRLEIVKEITSGLAGKHRAGGQSARRFERDREAKVNEYYKRAGNYADQIFLKVPNLKGILLGGPGPTKLDFLQGDYLHYTLKGKVLATLDTSYTGEQGIKEVVLKAQEALRNVRYFEEKNIMQLFLQHLGRDSGLATYGENEVREALRKRAVQTLLLSDSLNTLQLTLKCLNCGYSAEERSAPEELLKKEREISNTPCPSCSKTSLSVVDEKEIIEDLIAKGEQCGADIEIISTETEEGEGLLSSFGGIAAILKHHYKHS